MSIYSCGCGIDVPHFGSGLASQINRLAYKGPPPLQQVAATQSKANRQQEKVASILFLYLQIGCMGGWLGKNVAAHLWISV